MIKEEHRLFRQYLKQGHGRAYMILKKAPDIDEYRADVLWGCLNAFAYDAQCEGSRAYYLYRIASLFPDKESFVSAICDKYLLLSTRHGWEHLHFCELLNRYACDGNELAEETLRKKYRDIYGKMIARKRRGKQIYDCDRECLEHLAIVFAVRSINDWLEIAADLGQLTIESAYYRNHFMFDWLLHYSEEFYTRKRLLKLLERKKAGSKQLSVFYDKYLSEIEAENGIHARVNRSDTDSVKAEAMIAGARDNSLAVIDTVIFGRRADEDEKRTLAAAIEQESDHRIQAKLLEVYRGGDYPGSKQKLIEFTMSDDENLREIALDVFGDCKGEIIVSHALRLLESGESIYAAVCALLSNYDRKFKSSILKALKSESLTDDEVHGIVMTVTGAEDRGIHLPKEFFEFAYNRSPCSTCREYVVRHMSKHGWLSKEIAEECLYDCNSNIAEYVHRYYKMHY